MAELWELMLGLHIAWDDGHRQIIVECDSKVVLDVTFNPQETNLYHQGWQGEFIMHYYKSGRLI